MAQCLSGRWRCQYDGICYPQSRSLFFLFFLVGLFGYLGLKRIFKINWLGPLFIWLTVIGLAAFDEFHQFLTGDRTPSVHDIMLDGAGALTGILLCLIGQAVHTLIMKKKNPVKSLLVLNFMAL